MPDFTERFAVELVRAANAKPRMARSTLTSRFRLRHGIRRRGSISLASAADLARARGRGVRRDARADQHQHDQTRSP